MNKQFDKGIGELQEMRLTSEEKAAMLANIFARPVPSPYARHLRVYAYLQRFSPILAACLVAVFASGTLAFASSRALPGERLYTVKTKVVEPLRDSFAWTSEQKLEREGEKVARRLAEAERLAETNSLDEKKAEKLETEIEKSAAGFAAAAEKISDRQATTTEGKKERREELKEALKKKLEAKEEIRGAAPAEIIDKETRGEQEESRKKIEKLKERAMRTLEGKKGKD